MQSRDSLVSVSMWKLPGFFKTGFDYQFLSSLSGAYREGRAVHRVMVLFLMASQPLNLLKPYNKQRYAFLQYLEICLKSTTKSLMEAFQSFLLWQ